MRVSLNLCRFYALISLPFMPDTAETILGALHLEDEPTRWPAADAADWLDVLPHDGPVTPPPLLFRRIEDADVQAWAAQFGGALQNA
jgi:methionyl-tRNA synthetase